MKAWGSKTLGEDVDHTIHPTRDLFLAAWYYPAERSYPVCFYWYGTVPGS